MNYFIGRYLFKYWGESPFWKLLIFNCNRSGKMDDDEDDDADDENSDENDDGDVKRPSYQNVTMSNCQD